MINTAFEAYEVYIYMDEYCSRTSLYSNIDSRFDYFWHIVYKEIIRILRIFTPEHLLKNKFCLFVTKQEIKI